MGKKPAQKWEVGHKVRIGGNQYWVTGFGPPRAKGEARVTMLDSLDRTKSYEWVPFAGGLTLVRGDLVRPARAARRKAERAAQQAERDASRAATAAAEWLANPRPATPPPPAVPQLTAEELTFFRQLLARFKPGVNQAEMPQDGAPPEAARRPIATRSRG